MKNKIIILPALAILMLFVIMGVASACSCIYLEDTQARIENADYVFTGKISEIRLSGSEYNKEQEATIRITQYWKPSSFPESVNLIFYSTRDTGANCGYNFEEGKEYLIYASLDAETGKISTNSCMGNLLLEESKDEINELNDLIEPVSRPGTNDGKVEPIQKSVFSRLIDWIKSLFS
ncbi:MAG: hypothetical protein AABX23_02025 [Nanoarchaeota archaeon]